MTDFNPRERSSAGASAAILLVGTALGAAALLYMTPQGKHLLEQLAGLLEEWKTAAANTLAESREKVVSSVESRVPPETDGRLRENL